MTTTYWDASALIKRYIQETGSAWVRALLAPDTGRVWLTARITMVEFHSAIARRQREGTVPAAQCDVARAAFQAHSAGDYDFVELHLDVIHLAQSLLDRHPLRAYDAVQLASALFANRALLARNLPPLVFISADDRLNQVAEAEGLATDNPNLHP